jgi:hypothetical protein
MDLNGGNLVFIGQNKRLSALGPMVWSGKDKERMLRFFSAQVETRGIEMKQTQKAMLRLSKNTKLRSKSQ